MRKNLTKAERLLWSKIRCKQILGVQFYRQKPIGNYIVDFYAPTVRLVVELDGNQHGEDTHIIKDRIRDHYLVQKKIHIMRFSNLEVLWMLNGVLETIYNFIERRLNGKA